jgi:hypothetical protein
MDRLYEVLSSHDVALSVGVYLWPQQLLYDSENSRQVKIWRDWCVGKCKKFFDHFPTFFRYKEQNPDFVRNLFIGQDVHYNARGHQVLAEDLIEKYRVHSPTGKRLGELLPLISRQAAHERRGAADRQQCRQAAGASAEGATD